ncbi:hypothetical protein [Mycolicibacterium sp. XJ870]
MAAEPITAAEEKTPAESPLAIAVKDVRQRLAPVERDLRQRLEPVTAEMSRTIDAVTELAARRAASAPEPTAAENISTAIESTSPNSLFGPFPGEYPAVVEAIGSGIFNLIGTVIRTVDGPPMVPPSLRDSVETKSSTLVIAPGNEVQADWYFPTGQTPERMIYLQHGFLASGPMYSYTASYLADRTNSVVVVTSLTSNPFTEGGMWLGGDNMHKAVAQLFLDEDREALNTSLSTAAAKAGREDLIVPDRFVLVGHSLGGGFAPGVAGHYAEGLVARRADGQEAPNELDGVVVLDAVPVSPIMPNAMERLQQLEDSNNGDPADYVPVYEIGAPPNFLNSSSNINDELSAARPGKFNGVVVNDGAHMDGMLGGNPLIQVAAYLVAGIPQPQNPPAVQLLMSGWINDMFEEKIDPTTGRCLEDCDGTYGAPGETVVIPTDHGDASAVVIDSGSLPAAASPVYPRRGILLDIAV